MKKLLSFLFGLLVVASVALLFFLSIRTIWRSLASVNAELAIAVVTAAATIVGTAITVMLGRYFERKREIEAHFRADKIKIYDEFLFEFFKVFHLPNNDGDHLVNFLREWQRKLLLWGGSDVLITYFKWINRLKSGSPDAGSIFLMDEFFRALRSDIGQNSKGLQKGAFANLILRHGDFFLAQAARNPSITLAQLAVLEKSQFGEG